jgi:hypothetical protein
MVIRRLKWRRNCRVMHSIKTREEIRNGKELAGKNTDVLKFTG